MDPVRVLVVDDSVVVRKIVTDCLSGDPQVQVVGTASNGRLAQGKIAALKPDVVTMDIEMPEMNGIEAVREIRKTDRKLPIIMFSTLTERGASATMEALTAGASDYVTKPANVGSVQASMAQVREQLLPKLLALTGRHPTPASAAASPRLAAVAPAASHAAPAPPSPRSGPVRAPAVLVVGSSTGGPEALASFLPRLPASFPLPVLLVQHMPRCSPPTSPPASTSSAPCRWSRRPPGPSCVPAPPTWRPGTGTSASPTRTESDGQCSRSHHPRTSAGRRSTRCSAPPWRRSTAPSSPSS